MNPVAIIPAIKSKTIVCTPIPSGNSLNIFVTVSQNILKLDASTLLISYCLNINTGFTINLL